MSCGVLDALYAFVHPWLVRIGASFLVVDGHLRSSTQRMLHTAASTASVLLSFESLIIFYFMTFLFLGGALTILVLWPLICITAEQDEYDDCERGLYYVDGRDGQWISVAFPVILVERNGQMDGILVPTPTPHRNDNGPHRH
ncbi:hypothetical protein K438DRAFT_1863853 [Mycena galopus ATCC 62051]|nr:hypothetical protein K438DRAFT_1863853 [Mycena galopus ATCC 62051]